MKSVPVPEITIMVVGDYIQTDIPLGDGTVVRFLASEKAVFHIIRNYQRALRTLRQIPQIPLAAATEDRGITPWREDLHPPQTSE